MKVKFALNDGSFVDALYFEGETVLDVAHRVGVQITSFCEGGSICGACHVIIEDQSNLDPISDIEEQALDRAKGVTILSRLACRIKLDKRHSGLEIKIM